MNYKLLIAIIAVMVLAIVGASIWIGITLREDTVVEHPYDEGLKYDAIQKKYADLGWKVVSPPSLNKRQRLDVWVYDKNGAPLEGVTVDFVIKRIARSDAKRYRAVQAERGRYGAQVDFSAPGYWELKVNVTRGNDTLSFDNKMHIDE
ncbi:MAG TPA: FixH family protein [Desulfuromonadaceae bacterium]